MKDQATKNKSAKRKNLTLVAIFGVAVAAVGLWLAFSLIGAQKNYAQQAAKPLEDALIKAGATKVCDTGDSGRGADNRTPWYTVYLESSKSHEAAKNLIVDIAKTNGFSVQQAAEGAKGYLGDVVYEDKNTASVNTDLKDGSVNLAIALTNSGTLHACKDDVTNDAEHTAITLEVRLPEFK